MKLREVRLHFALDPPPLLVERGEIGGRRRHVGFYSPRFLDGNLPLEVERAQISEKRARFSSQAIGLGMQDLETIGGSARLTFGALDFGGLLCER
jgi:hypothetical protein